MQFQNLGACDIENKSPFADVLILVTRRVVNKKLSVFALIHKNLLNGSPSSRAVNFLIS